MNDILIRRVNGADNRWEQRVDSTRTVLTHLLRHEVLVEHDGIASNRNPCDKICSLDKRRHDDESTKRNTKLANLHKTNIQTIRRYM
jgi:hypothetical protein